MRLNSTAGSRCLWALVAVLAAAPVAAWASQSQVEAPGSNAFQARLDGGSRSAAAPGVERTAWIMGTRARVTVEAADRATALAASEAVLVAMAEVEARLSTWRDDSELTRLNRTEPGTVARPSTTLASLLAEIAGWVELTDGAFHPAVGALVDAWDLRGEGRVPPPDVLRRALSASAAGGIEIDATTGTILRKDATAWLDAGGFGKGVALREAREALEAANVSSARVDLGGQLLLVGDASVRVPVAHPLHRSQPAADLDLRRTSVATSGQSERGIEIGGERYGHLLDPRDGKPAPAWGSVTVVHADPVAADVLATALFVLGPREGLSLARSLDVAALFLVATDDGVTSFPTPALRGHLFTSARPLSQPR